MRTWRNTIEANPGLEWRANLFRDPVARLRYLRRATAPRRSWRHWHFHPLRIQAWALLLALASIPYVVSDASTHGYPRARAHSAPAPLREVWQVENTGEYTVFSNGLRVENQFTIPTRPRLESAGIVFHTTESLQLPLEPARNQSLKSVGESLLEYVRRKRAYHFVIDRFGRVYNVVAESDVANHAGNSVWASGRRAYVSLNASFLGVAFEAQSPREGESVAITAAQVYSGRILTEWLRSRYHISEENCVTHAQVSVNPGNMRAGYHMDWARAFPFRELGLPDNYWRPLPSVHLFGFICDASFHQRAGAPLAQGITLAEGILHDTALTEGYSVPAYRQLLQKRYRQMTSALHTGSASKEIWSEANGESSDAGDRP